MYTSKLYESVTDMVESLKPPEDTLEQMNSQILINGFLKNDTEFTYETIKKCLECYGYELPNFIRLKDDKDLLKYIPSKLNEHINENSKYNLEGIFGNSVKIELSKTLFTDYLLYSDLVPYELRNDVPKDSESVVSKICDGLIDKDNLQKYNVMTSLLNLRMLSNGIIMNDYIKRISNEAYEVSINGKLHTFSNGVIISFNDGKVIKNVLYGELAKRKPSKIILKDEKKTVKHKFHGKDFKQKFEKYIDKVWKNIMKANGERLSDNKKTIEKIHHGLFNHLSEEMVSWKLLQEVFGIYGNDIKQFIDEFYQSHTKGHLDEIKNEADKNKLNSLEKQLSIILEKRTPILFKKMDIIEFEGDVYTSFGKLEPGQSIVFNQYGIFVISSIGNNHKLSLRTLQECSLGIVGIPAEDSHEKTLEKNVNILEEFVKRRSKKSVESHKETTEKHTSDNIEKSANDNNHQEDSKESSQASIAKETIKSTAENDDKNISEKPVESTAEKNAENTDEKPPENSPENSPEKPPEDNIIKQQPSETKIDNDNSGTKNKEKEEIKKVDAKSVEEIKEEILKDATEITDAQYNSLINETDILINEYPYIRAHNSYDRQCWWWSSLRCLIYYARGNVNDFVLGNIGLYNIYKYKRENTKELLVIISFITNPINNDRTGFVDNKPYIKPGDIIHDYSIQDDKMGSAIEVLGVAFITQSVAIGSYVNNWPEKESIENTIKASDFILVNVDNIHFYTYLKNHDKNEFAKYDQATLHGLTNETYKNIDDVTNDISRKNLTTFFYKLHISDNGQFSEPPVTEYGYYSANMSGGKSNKSPKHFSKHSFNKPPFKSLIQFTMNLNKEIPSTLFAIIMKKIFKIYSLRYTDTLFACRTVKELLMFILSIIPSIYTYDDYIYGTPSTTFYDVRYNDFIKRFIRAFSMNMPQKPEDDNTRQMIEIYNSIDDFYESIRTIGRAFAE